ncbi:hypothetical protein AVI51_10560 [Piscirickettsia salmonis]|uniref:hypothetical protein n=1 Tax=Piscirickettsia salmonis TaxID=1238 RepID=UPI0006849627|nr:hypothetical protein [Piscirickettsia salmonis]APS43958.1 hypothetical protein AVI48_05955 [Piscirickettsia salmonis]APS47313.1 hypothetical protein AVI49_06560 [Piscirickettsia salmonis]APS51250.1 hypothetical protein AVI50_10665 [Piscirickettsia salmonis]APS54459.1 hypothetical protein AVI51_10560 [Piscirickettsia salmonis]APS57543.1 hypothetical protein AVI52_10005 [Piscirickettsia salmonis]
MIIPGDFFFATKHADNGIDNMVWNVFFVSGVISPPGTASLKEVFDGMEGTQWDQLTIKQAINHTGGLGFSKALPKSPAQRAYS